MSPELLAKIKDLRGWEWGWDKIACHIGISRFRIRCALEPGWREYRRAHVQEYRARKRGELTAKPKIVRTNRGYLYKSNPSLLVQERVEIPKEVLLDRERRLAASPKDLTAMLCGDPLPGQSALDCRT